MPHTFRTNRPWFFLLDFKSPFFATMTPPAGWRQRGENGGFLLLLIIQKVRDMENTKIYSPATLDWQGLQV